MIGHYRTSISIAINESNGHIGWAVAQYWNRTLEASYADANRDLQIASLPDWWILP